MKSIIGNLIFETLFQNRKHNLPSSSEVRLVAFLLYGGLGDVLMAVPAVMEACKKTRCVLFIPRKLMDATRVLNFGKNISIIYYSKKSFLIHAVIFRVRFIFDSRYLVVISPNPGLKGLVGSLLLSSHFLGFISWNKICMREKIESTDSDSKNKVLVKIVRDLLDIKNNGVSVYEPDLLNFDRDAVFSKYLGFSGPYVVLCPEKTSNWGVGDLDEATIFEFVQLFRERFQMMKLVILGSKKSNDLLKGLQKVFDCRGSTSFSEAAVIIERSSAAVVVDNGLMHLSYLLKRSARVVPIFQFSDPLVYAWSRENKLSSRSLPCQPCVPDFSDDFSDNKPFHCALGFACRKTVDIDLVIGSLATILDGDDYDSCM